MASTPRRMHTLTLLSDPAVTISVGNPTSSLITGLPLLSLSISTFYSLGSIREFPNSGIPKREFTNRRSISTVLDNTFWTFLGVMLCLPGLGPSYFPNPGLTLSLAELHGRQSCDSHC